MSKLIETLVRLTGLSDLDVRRIIVSAPKRYKHYSIPKRSGGSRPIAQPARELKLLQRAFVEHFLGGLPIHDAAAAYRRGHSIRSNAARHADNGPILKLDFADFFPSLTSSDWARYCEKHDIFQSDGEVFLTSQLLFHHVKGRTKIRLAIGAPSSPVVSNLLMFEFDSLLTTRLEIEGRGKIVYSRYADDLTFSAPRLGYLKSVEKIVRQTLRDIGSPSLRINDAKRVVATKKVQRRVTGLIITNDNKVSLGRPRKRILRSALERYAHGKLNAEEINWLRGMLAFSKDVEPEFLEVLQRKFGDSVLSLVRQSNDPQ
jgi:hypothetical protein